MRPFGPGAVLAPGVRVLAHMHRSRRFDVYDAWCEHRACRVVGKALRPDRRQDPGARRALLREGLLLRRLTHPHIVRGYEIHDGPRPAILMETVGGETLAHLVRRTRLTTAEVTHLGMHVASALRYLHAERVLHLDLKADNVVAEAGRAKLIDLSIAQPPGVVPAGRGTWCSMAPEQVRGGEVGPSADVWGLGLLLYEAVVGEQPFAGDDAEWPQLVRRVEPLRARRRLRRDLAALVDACLEPEPDARPALDDVLAVLGRGGGQAASAHAVASRSKP